MNPFSLLSQLDREIWIVTAQAAERRGGLVATFVSSASIVTELPRVVVGIAKQHHTWGLIEASSVFALHLIDERQIDLVWHFGLQSGRAGDKLADLTVEAGATGAPLLTDAVACLECRVEARMDTGDRTVYLAAVPYGGRRRETPVLTMRRLLELTPPEKLRDLKTGLDRDAAVDAAAIREWRTHRS